MKRIFKYELQTYTELEVPIGGIIRKVHMQGNNPCIWIEVNTKMDKEKRIFRTYGTGHEIDEEYNLNFLDTVFFNNGLVFHIFEDIS